MVGYLCSHGPNQPYLQRVLASYMGRIVHPAFDATCNLINFLMLGNMLLFLVHNMFN